LAVSEPVWLTPEEIIDINEFVVGETNEPFFVRSQELLDSAVARPQNHHAYGEGDVVTLAFVLLEGIAQNHPFEQGNKRTAFVAANVMLEQNGYVLDAPENETELGELVENLVAGHIALEDFTETLRPYVIAR
jgi:death-on-curing protein